MSDWVKNKGGATPGFANSVRTSMQRSKFAPVLVRNNFQLGGWVVIGGSTERIVFVTWRPSDDIADEDIPRMRKEALRAYVPVLERAGFLVKWDDEGLIVSKKPNPWTPVHKTGTNELVGWIRTGQFWNLEKDGPLPASELNG